MDPIPLLDPRTRDELHLLLGYTPDPSAVAHVRNVLRGRELPETPYLLAAFLCYLWGGEAGQAKAESYARREGWDPRLLGIAPMATR